MKETAEIVSLWKRAKALTAEVYLATVVHVSGSAYRKQGSRMLVTASGEHAGSISGGCLEAEISRRIAWLTRSGAVVKRYSSSFDDEGEDVSYGLGCGGTIWLLMEAGSTARAVLNAMQEALDHRLSFVAILSLQENSCGTIVATQGQNDELLFGPDLSTSLVREHSRLSGFALSENRVVSLPDTRDQLPRYVYTPIVPSSRLFVLGAGDDAKPLVRFAAELGWQVTVADGRSHLLRRERFQDASNLQLLRYEIRQDDFVIEDSSLVSELDLEASDFVVILTHSITQDRALLKALLPRSLRYLGLLGPLHRTRRLVSEIAPSLGITPQACLEKLHAPVGLDFGGGEASVVALSIVSEIQTVLGRTSGIVERKRNTSQVAS